MAELKSPSYRNCEKLVKRLVMAGQLRVNRNFLEKIIRACLGGDDRTVKKYVRLLLQFEFLKVVSMGPQGIYCVNLSRVPDFKQLTLPDVIVREEEPMKRS